MTLRAALLATGLVGLPTLAFAADPDLSSHPGKEWLSIGGDWKNSRYSTLNQITPANVATMKGAWVAHLSSGIGSRYGLSATPIVQNGVMYVTSGNNEVYAFDARTGSLIWQYFSKIDQTNATNCCGWLNRGVAVGDGKVFQGQLDGQMVALDAKTGDVVWKSKLEVPTADGGVYAITAAPLYYNGRIYTGISGGDRRARGFLAALDAKTGKEVWRFWTVPEPGQFGADTWPAPNDPNPQAASAWKVGGANVWNTPAIDPELGMLYFTTGQPGPAAIGVGANRKGDNLFSASIMALKLDGTYAWHFQEVHHDLWDFDTPSPVVLFEQTYGGQLRKGIAHAGKTGWVYMLDRTNGQPLIGINETPVEQDAKRFTAPTQPIPVGDALIRHCPDPVPGWEVKCIFGVPNSPVVMSPGGNGGINWANMAFNPQTGYFYVSAADRPAARLLPEVGTRPVSIGVKYAGTYTALDSRTNKIVWQKKTTYSIGQGSGTLATASGLLFHGEPDGRFLAMDARNGDVLWQWQTGAGADAPAITYELDGVQYVTIAAGGVPTQTTSYNGDLLWTFSLNGNPNGHVLKQFPAPPPPPTGIYWEDQEMAQSERIRIVDFAFTPMRIGVEAGKAVSFQNAGSQPYTIVPADGKDWKLGTVQPGETATVTFSQPGTYTFWADQQRYMAGQIVVRAPGQARN